MTTSLFIRNYAADAEWLRYCLRSLRKFATGFDQQVIVTPESSHSVIQPIAKEFGWEYDVCPLLAKDDYVGQQGTKLTADNWCSGDVICFVDSDLIFTRAFTPECLLDKSGKLLVLKASYATIETPWQDITEQVVGFPVLWEYMRRLPLAYPRELLRTVREHITETHGKSFEDFMKDIPKRQFSEFNVLGAVAEKFLPEKHSFIDTHSVETLPPTYGHQYWSWGGVTPGITQEIEKLLA